MSSRFTYVLMAAALAAPLFAGAALAQPSGGLGPNSAGSTVEPPNSLPRGGQAQGQGAALNDGRIILNPAQSAEATPMARPANTMTLRQARQARQARRARARARRAPMTQSMAPASAPSAGPGSMSNASPR